MSAGMHRRRRARQKAREEAEKATLIKEPPTKKTPEGGAKNGVSNSKVVSDD